MLAHRWVVALACLSFVACVDAMTPAPDSGDDPMLDSRLLAGMTGYRTFPKIDARAYQSSLGSYEINLFVRGSTAAYANVHPEISGSDPQIAVGTAIVREVLDATGQVGKLTMMVKAPHGYDPTLGDWWFAVTDPEGNVLPDDTGEPQIGRLTACHSCHVPRASDDFLFGVPKTDEGP